MSILPSLLDNATAVSLASSSQGIGIASLFRKMRRPDLRQTTSLKFAQLGATLLVCTDNHEAWGDTWLPAIAASS